MKDSIFEMQAQLDLGMFPYPVSLQQLKSYKEDRDYLYATPKAQIFTEGVLGNMANYSKEVTTVYVIGDGKGTKKSGDISQLLAEAYLNPRLRKKLAKSEMEPMVHATSVGRFFRMLRPYGLITSEHTKYTQNEFARGWLALRTAVDLARVYLPLHYPEYTHLLTVEVPFNTLVLGDVIERAISVDRNTFIKMNLTNPIVQEKAAEVSDETAKISLELSIPQENSQNLTDERRSLLAKTWEKFGVIVDKPDITPDEVTWDMGTRTSMEQGRKLVSQFLVDVQKDLAIPRRRKFTLEELEKKPEFRDRVALPAFYAHLLMEVWRVPEMGGHWLIDKTPLIEKTKHYFWQLTYAFSLGSRDNGLPCAFPMEKIIDFRQLF